MKKIDSHIFQGMQRDLSVSKQQPQFLWDAVNVRLTAREGDTLMSVTNEKGTVESGIYCEGFYMGHCVVGDYLVVFTTDGDGKDRIYRIDKMFDGTFTGPKLLYGNSEQGSLGFSPEYPLQTLGVYENEFIQKVYWTDGVKQPRVINIVKDALNPAAADAYNEKSFDFVPEMELKDSINIQKLSDSSGNFNAGVIQYAVTYYNKYGQQSNISCVSPLIPISFFNRAGSPEEKVSNSFRVIVNGPDNSFEYLRLYSIFRSSPNGTPVCRRVEDVRLGNGGSSNDVYNPVTGGTATKSGFVYKINPAYSYSNGAGGSSYSPDTKSNQQGIPYINNGYNYYYFSKSDCPYLVVYVYDVNSRSEKWITWGDATDIYITQGEATGGYGSGYYIVGTNENKKAASLLVSSDKIEYEQTQKVETVTIIDNGTIGETIDPQELLYIGGDEITAETIESKDGTLFFGNIKLTQVQIEGLKNDIENGVTIYNDTTRQITRAIALKGDNYIWGNSLNSTVSGYATNPAGFKCGEHYRLGVQFQYKNGKWSEPVYIPHLVNDVDSGSHICLGKPKLSTTTETEKYDTPRFYGTLSKSVGEKLYEKGYRRVRGVVVFPTTQDRLILAQGVLNPTVASITAHAQHSPDYQSSWFFRPWLNGSIDNDIRILQGAAVEWQHHFKLFGFNNRGSEIQGLPKEYNSWTINNETINFGSETTIRLGTATATGDDAHKVVANKDLADNVFYVDQQYVTMHSPEFEFDDSLKNLDFIGTYLKKRGFVEFENNVGDILIETSSPPIGRRSSGFIHKTLNWSYSNTSSYCRRLCAGIFYNDWLVDEGSDNNYFECSRQFYEFGFMVYPWHKSGSLNNDCNRPANSGTRTAVLKRKIISNILYGRESFFRDYGLNSDIPLATTTVGSDTVTIVPQLFDSDQISLVKIGGNNYYGNIDTLLTPIEQYSSIFSTGGCTTSIRAKETAPFEGTYSYSSNIFNATSDTFWRGTWDCPELISRNGSTDGGIDRDGVGHENRALLLSKESIRMKYKSSAHMVLKLGSALLHPVGTGSGESSSRPNSLHLVELCRNGNSSTDFGGISPDAIQANVWIPAGDAKSLNTSDITTFYYEWGDTWYQRYDCLKTYPFTREDENQVVEIGSFMVETHVNIDGRYDKNRGQDSNLYMTPENFNLINPVYSQLDNFFSYKIMDSDFYKLSNFPATVAWTLQKNNASEVDAWTNITLSNTLDMDGTMGQVTSINSSNDTLYCFQERGVSQIMFNSRVQIPTSDEVPIEISNSYKVDGSRTISNTVGCYNKFAIAKSAMGLYFVDGVGSTLYLLQGNQMQNISDNHGMGYWFSQQDTQRRWIPSSGEGGVDRMAQGMRVCYDSVNNDLYMLPYEGKTLCYSEQLQQFVSFFDYYPYAIFNIGNSVHAIGDDDGSVGMWNLFEGDYNKLMGTFYPSSITFISNADMTFDKIFTNLETRTDFYLGEELQHMHFFDTIRVWNEYQDTDWVDGYGEEHTTILEHKYFPYSSTSIGSNVKKKFRIWRIDIPRAKRWVAYTEAEKQAMIDGGQYTSVTVPEGHLINVNDRIRNTWCKIKLTMNIPPTNSDEIETYQTHRMEMHDIGVIYYV